MLGERLELAYTANKNWAVLARVGGERGKTFRVRSTSSLSIQIYFRGRPANFTINYSLCGAPLARSTIKTILNVQTLLHDFQPGPRVRVAG